MKLSAILAPLIAAKAPHALILETILAFEAQQDDALDRRRESDRERQARMRSKATPSRDVTLRHSDRSLTGGDAPVEDNLLTKVIEPQVSKKDSSLRSEAIQTQKRATRLKSDFVLLPDWRQIALALGLPEHLISLEFEKMRDWSMSSKNGARLDWPATWRNWCREAVGRLPRNRNGPSGAAKPDSLEAAFERRREKRNADELQARIADESVVLQLSNFSVG